MKTKKRFERGISLITVFMILLSLFTTAFAADTTNITIEGGSDNAKYAAYHLLNATITDSGSGISYTVNGKYTDALFVATGKNNNAAVIKAISEYNENDLRVFAENIYNEITTAGLTPEEIGENGEFTGMDKGYYLIADVTEEVSEAEKSLLILNTKNKDNLTVNKKSGVPTLEKKVKETNDSTVTVSDWQDAADYDIGDDNIPFKLTATLPDNISSYRKYKMDFHDNMSDGLTFNNDVKVLIDGIEIDSEHYSVINPATDGHTFDIVINNLKATGMPVVTKKSKVVVEYSATLNENAVIGSAGNPNAASLEYSNDVNYNGEDDETPTDQTPEDEVTVFTYRMVVNKVDGDNNALEGAGFTLYKLVNGAAQAVKEIKSTDENPITEFKFEGLDAGDYKLAETTVPDGYNEIDPILFTVEATYDTEAAEPKFKELKVVDSENHNNVLTDFTIDEDKNITTTIENNTGLELPSTGGIGTVIFYVLGALMVLGALLMMNKKKVNN